MPAPAEDEEADDYHGFASVSIGEDTGHWDEYDRWYSDERNHQPELAGVVPNGSIDESKIGDTGDM